MRLPKRSPLLLVLYLSLPACAPVAPWERGYLAKPHMALDPYPQQAAIREHVHSSREAGAKAQTAGGGGCGCY